MQTYTRCSGGNKNTPYSNHASRWELGPGSCLAAQRGFTIRVRLVSGRPNHFLDSDSAVIPKRS